MGCGKCANYEPVKAERPEDHPGRIFTEDLQIGMVIQRHAVTQRRKLVVVLGEVGDYKVPALQLLAGHEPFECDMWLAAAGLQPHKESGRWHHSAWCEEVT